MSEKTRATQDGSADCSYTTLVDVINMNCDGNSAPWTCAVHNIHNISNNPGKELLRKEHLCKTLYGKEELAK